MAKKHTAKSDTFTEEQERDLRTRIYNIGVVISYHEHLLNDLKKKRDEMYDELKASIPTTSKPVES